MNVVIVEIDYKGEYERFALTVEDFTKDYANVYDIQIPIKHAPVTWTLRPMVHGYCSLVEIGDNIWNEFMNDMFWGLPFSDVQNGNAAYVNYDKFSRIILHCL